MPAITADADYWRQRANEMQEVLVRSRAALVLCGFVGPGPHGGGDPEINQIDDVIGRPSTTPHES